MKGDILFEKIAGISDEYIAEAALVQTVESIPTVDAEMPLTAPAHIIASTFSLFFPGNKMCATFSTDDFPGEYITVRIAG